jgi:hypothetical protein
MKQDEKGRFTEASHVESSHNWSRIAMLAVIVLLIFAWIGKPTESPVPVATPTPTPYTKIQGDEMKDAYMSECNSSGTMKDYCECGYKVLQADYSLEEAAVVMNNEVETKKYTDKAFNICQDRL